MSPANPPQRPHLSAVQSQVAKSKPEEAEEENLGSIRRARVHEPSEIVPVDAFATEGKSNCFESNFFEEYWTFTLRWAVAIGQ